MTWQMQICKFAKWNKTPGSGPEYPEITTNKKSQKSRKRLKLEFQVLGYNVAVAPIVEGFDSLDPQASYTSVKSLSSK